MKDARATGRIRRHFVNARGPIAGVCGLLAVLTVSLLFLYQLYRLLLFFATFSLV